jgi:hypothetical protein
MEIRKKAEKLFAACWVGPQSGIAQSMLFFQFSFSAYKMRRRDEE